MIELNKIKKIISKFIDITKNEVYYFGSRAKGTHRANSDLDILILDNSPIKSLNIAQLTEEFEESDIPFKVDVIIRSRITNDFYSKIENELVKIDF